MDVAGEVTKTIGDNRIITEAEAMAGICNKDQQGQGYRSYGYGQNPQPQQQPYYDQQPRPAQSQQAANICQLCHNQGHFHYQCQCAGDFLARTQQAFNRGRQCYHQDGQGQWSQGDNDNENPNDQLFQ